MTRTKLAAAAVALSAVAFAAYQVNRYQAGIRNTEKGLERINDELQQTRNDALKLLAAAAADPAVKAAAALGDPFTWLSQEITELRHVVTAAQGTEEFRKGDVAMGVSKTAELTAKLLAETAKELDKAGIELGEVAGPLAMYGGTAVKLALKIVEAIGIVQRIGQLKVAQLQLQNALGRLKRNDELEFWGNIQERLRDDQLLHQKWLSEHNVDSKQVLDAVTKDVSAVAGPRAASEAARGVTIVDPKRGLMDLQKVSQINPDFIAAMQAEDFIAEHALSDPRWLSFSATHYPDGTYIPMFGPCRGIDIPNPIAGGIIASSTLACKTRVSSPALFSEQHKTGVSISYQGPTTPEGNPTILIANPRGGVFNFKNSYPSGETIDFYLTDSQDEMIAAYGQGPWTFTVTVCGTVGWAQGNQGGQHCEDTRWAELFLQPKRTVLEPRTYKVALQFGQVTEVTVR